MVSQIEVTQRIPICTATKDVYAARITADDIQMLDCRFHAMGGGFTWNMFQQLSATDTHHHNLTNTCWRLKIMNFPSHHTLADDKGRPG